MESCSRIVSCLFALAVVAGCASTTVTNRQQLVKEKLARPAYILVYDFAATPADIPADSPVAGPFATPSTPPSAEHLATGRQLGAEIMARQALPQLNDIVVRGFKKRDKTQLEVSVTQLLGPRLHAERHAREAVA